MPTICISLRFYCNLQVSNYHSSLKSSTVLTDTATTSLAYKEVVEDTCRCSGRQESVFKTRNSRVFGIEPFPSIFIYLCLEI